MDPNAPGQMTPGATPPSSPPWGAPPPQPDPAAVAPPPEWAVAAPTKSAGTGVGGAVGAAIGRRLLGALGVIIVIGVIVGGVFIYQKVANPDHLGQVIFTTAPQAGQTGCDITDQVTSVKVGTPVYAMYIWQHQLSATQQVHEEDFKDGVSFDTYDVPTDKSSDADCLRITDDWSSSFDTAGAYEVKLTVGQEVIAEGKLTVTP